MSFSVNINRIIGDIDAVTGGAAACTRPSYGAADAEARAYFFRAFEELGLEVRTDGAGNIRAAMKGKEPELAPVLVGSHIDTVNNGGRFDGLLGVVCALECLRIFKEKGHVPRRNVEVVIFAEEEASNFGVTLLGSKLLTGKLAPASLKGIFNDARQSADDVIRNAGFDPSRFAEADETEASERNDDDDESGHASEILQPDEVYAMMEMHIEQGSVLESSKVSVGIVENIAGMETYRVVLTGPSGHAGGTPMANRKDPMVAAAEIILCVQKAAEGADSGTAVATVGKLSVRPGATNVIAREVEFFVDIRDSNDASVEELADSLKFFTESIGGKQGLTTDVCRISKSLAIGLDGDVIETIDRAAKDLGTPGLHMYSGPVHDAGMMAGVTRVGMIFVPSIGGLSHCPEEDTRPTDIETGANVLLETVKRLAEGV